MLYKSMAYLPKKIPKELINDWTDQPGKERFSRINRMMSSNDTRQINTYSTAEKNPNPMPNYSTIYGLDKNKKWKELGKRCLDCGKALSNPKALELHPELCDLSLKINKENNTEEVEILSKVRKQNANT